MADAAGKFPSASPVRPHLRVLTWILHLSLGLHVSLVTDSLCGSAPSSLQPASTYLWFLLNHNFSSPLASGGHGADSASTPHDPSAQPPTAKCLHFLSVSQRLERENWIGGSQASGTAGFDEVFICEPAASVEWGGEVSVGQGI